MIRRSSLCRLAAVCFFATFSHWAANAQEPQRIGEFNDWAAYSYKADAGQVCYIVSQPNESDPKNVNRDPIFFLVTHRPGDKVRNEVNTIIGYPFKEGSTATVTIGSDKFELFTSGDGAWAESAARDAEIVEAMKRGANMQVQGTSWRGTTTTDRYSLSGVTAAMAKIDETCS